MQNGLDLVNRLATWLALYLWFPMPGQARIAALWIVHTWLLDHFTSTPYMSITARTKRAGKTTLLELLAAASRGGTLLATVRPAAMVRLLHAMDGRVTLCMDEMESLSKSSVGDVRSILATGYRRGQYHITSSGDKVKAWRTFGAKAFALIGDLSDVIRDRSIIMRLQRAPRGVQVLDYTNPAIRAKAHAEAAELAGEIQAYLEHRGKPAFTAPEFLHGRESEIWLPIWTAAHHCQLPEAMLREISGAMVDISAIKSEPPSRWSALADDAEKEQEEADTAERILTDCKRVIREDEAKIKSTELVERLRSIETSPWRVWRGTGIDAITLSALLSRFNIQPSAMRFGKSKSGDNSNVVKGYDANAIRKAHP